MNFTLLRICWVSYVYVISLYKTKILKALQPQNFIYKVNRYDRVFIVILQYTYQKKIYEIYCICSIIAKVVKKMLQSPQVFGNINIFINRVYVFIQPKKPWN